MGAPPLPHIAPQRPVSVCVSLTTSTTTSTTKTRPCTNPVPFFLPEMGKLAIYLRVCALSLCPYLPSLPRRAKKRKRGAVFHSYASRSRMSKRIRVLKSASSFAEDESRNERDIEQLRKDPNKGNNAELTRLARRVHFHIYIYCKSR